MILVWCARASAADLQWSPNGVTPGGGGTGSWNISSAFWYNGATFQTWSNAAVDNAVFGGTAGTVTINAPVTAHNLTFNTSGYTIARSGGANFLTLGGISPTIDVLSGGSATISSPIAGTAGLSKAGLGTLTFSGNNTYTGATAVNAGTLQAGANSTFVSNSAFTVASGATLGLNNFNQTIGSLAGAGTVTNGGANNRTLTTGGDNTSTVFSGVIQNGGAGTLALTKNGSGTFTLSGTNTYTGTTTISAGTLQIGSGGTSGSVAGNIVNNAALVFNRSDTLTYSGVISGTGTLTQAGAGTLILTGANTYSGGTTISAGTLQIGNGGTLQAGAVNVAPGATLNLSSFGQTIGSLAGAGSVTLGSATLTTGNDNTDTTFSGTLSGTGSLTKIGSGTLVLSGANTYTGGTTLASGTLSLANNQALGTGSLTTTGSVVDYADGVTIGNPIIVNSNTTQLSVTTGTATQAGAISELNGPRPIEKVGGGTLVLTGDNTYSGPTTISAGTLVLGNGGTSGSILGDVVNNGVFAINRSDTFTFGNVISGSGAFMQIGSGTTVLTANNTYSGATTVAAGTLIVNGSIVNSVVTVNSGAALAGSGAVGQTTITSGGTFAPGPTSTPGTMTVQGNLAIQSGALYLVQVTSSAASSANVSGSAALAGTVAALFSSGNLSRTYTIVSAAGGRSGTFENLIAVNLLPGFTASLSYTATDAILNLTATLGGPGTLGASGLSVNQRNVADAQNAFFNSGGTLTPSFLTIFGLTGGDLGSALTLLSGEAATGGQQGAFQLTNQFLGIMLDPFVDGRDAVAGGNGGLAIGFAPERETVPEDLALAYAKVLKAPPMTAASFEQRWGVWGSPYGGSHRTTGDPAVVGSHDLAARTAGFAAGLDYHLSRDSIIGFALAGGNTNWSLAQGLGGGKSDVFQAGVYGVTRSGPAYLAAALAFANHWMSTDRFAFAADHLSASFNASSLGARVESGYRFATVHGGLTPYAALQVQSFRTPSYSEIDLIRGGFALTYNGHIASDTRTELGARFDRVLALYTNPVYSNAVLSLRARLAWAHDWVTDPTLAAVFQALPGASFLVNGATPAKNAALTSIGAELHLGNGITLLGKFDGEFANHSSTYAGTGTVRYRW